MVPRSASRWQVDDYLSYLLARASHVVASEFHREVRDAGLTVLEWRVLATLANGAERTVGELASIALAQQSTVTKLLGRMEAVRWIERNDGDVDRRQSLVRITPRGQRVLGDLLARSKRHESTTTTRLTAREAALLKNALRKLIRAESSPGLRVARKRTPVRTRGVAKEHGG